jgi:hypothetical protein
MLFTPEKHKKNVEFFLLQKQKRKEKIWGFLQQPTGISSREDLTPKHRTEKGGFLHFALLRLSI